MNAALPPLLSLRDLLERNHRRLVLFAVVLAGAMLILSGFLTVRSYAARNLDLIARSVAYTVEPAMVFGDPATIREGMVSVAGTDAVNRVEVRGAQGQLISGWDRPVNGTFDRWEVAFGRQLWPEPTRQPVFHNGRMIGEVSIYGGGGGMLRFLISGAIISLCCMGLTILATRILAKRLNDDVLGPLNQIGSVGHSIRVDRAFSRRMPASGIAEIDRFGQDFNALLAELEIWTTDLSSQNEELAHHVMHDPLTGIGNRAMFERDLDAIVQETLRSGQPSALLFMDVNRFKAINDSQGHQAGDMMLKAVAKRLGASVRQFDTVYRLGGDEFAVILAAVADRDQVDRVVGRIHAAMAKPVAFDEASSVVASLSIGSALCPDDGHDPAVLVRLADVRMYDAKAKQGEHAR